MEFFDTHAHLPLLTHTATDAAVERSVQAGVTRMVTVATESSNWESSRQCAEKYPFIHYTLGLHPHQAKDWPRCEKELEKLFATGTPSKCVGIGETGLDFYYKFADRDSQIENLEGQLRLAKKHELPVILHCREAFAELFASLKKIGLSAGGGVMHCFTGTEPDAKAALDLGLCISFSGILTFQNAQPLRDVATRLPLSRMVIETDCPYLSPIPHRGKPNEPSFLPHTAEVLGRCLGVPLEEVARATTDNARALFRV